MFKETFKITNNSLILTIPMILCLKIIEIYTKYINSSADSGAKFLFAFLTLIFMTGAFCAGFFYLIKLAVEIHKKEYVLHSDRTKDILGLLKNFPEGIAQYFLPFTGAYVSFITMQILLLPIIAILGLKLFGGMSPEFVNTLQTFANDSNSFVDNLTEQQILYLGYWVLLFLAFLFVLVYFLMLWIPEIMYKTKNPVKAIFTSIVKVFRRFLKTIGLYLSAFVFIFAFAFTMTFLPKNPLLILLFEVIKYYSYLYFIFLVFLFYDKNFNTSMVENAELKEEE